MILSKKLLFVVMALSLLCMFGCSPKENQQPYSHEVKVYLFYGEGCFPCAKAHAFLDSIKGKYPTMKLIEYEVFYNNSNWELLQQYAKICNSTIKGVPTIFIDRKVFVGFSKENAGMIEKEISRCLTEECKDFEDEH